MLPPLPPWTVAPMKGASLMTEEDKLDCIVCFCAVFLQMTVNINPKELKLKKKSWEKWKSTEHNNGS